MKRFITFLTLLLLGFAAFSQNTSPLVVKDFVLKSNEIIDLEQIPKFNRTDLDNNPICRIKVKAQGFEEGVLQKLVFVPNGIEITHMVYKDGMWYLHVSSNKSGEINIKYMGDFTFRLPYQLEPGKVYELSVGMETATLVIRTIPTNAEIYIDNEKVGVGEAIKAVSIGAEHQYRVSCNDYYTKDDVVTFVKSEKKELYVELEPDFNYITIKTEPSGADIYVDGKKVGKTPYLSEKIKFGRHRIELRKNGFENYVKVVTIKAEEEENTQLSDVKLIKDETYANLTGIYGGNSTTTTNMGVFSISSKEKVYISPGNLQYQASTNTWRFAEHPWDIIGVDNKNISPDYDGWIDLFGWGTSGYDGKYPYMTSKDVNDYPTVHILKKTNYDWGVFNDIDGTEYKGWHTMNNNDWRYMLEYRETNSGIRYAKAEVNGVCGLIILPNNWDKSNYRLYKPNDPEVQFSSNRISISDWLKYFEVAGAVFLPVTGMRNGNNYVGKNTDGGIGDYWGTMSAGSSNDMGWCITFNNSGLDLSIGAYKSYGLAVRLVRNVE